MEYEPTDGWPWNINIDGDRLTNINFQTIESAITENEAQQAAPQAFSRNQEQQGFFTPAPLSFWENDDPMQGISMATPQFIDDPDLMRQSEQYLQSINRPFSLYDEEQDYQQAVLGLTGPGRDRSKSTRSRPLTFDGSSSWGTGWTENQPGYTGARSSTNRSDGQGRSGIGTHSAMESGNRGFGGNEPGDFRDYWGQGGIENWLRSCNVNDSPFLGGNVYHPNDINEGFANLVRSGAIDPDSLWWRRRVGK